MLAEAGRGGVQRSVLSMPVQDVYDIIYSQTMRCLQPVMAIGVAIDVGGLVHVVAMVGMVSSLAK